MRILIAEDDFHVRRLLESLLIKWGYEVIVAKDGKEAWEVLQQGDSPSMAILDRVMPGMDGVTICRKLRENRDAHPHYLLLLTAMDDKEDVVEGLHAGADDYVTKPFSFEELRARVEVGARVVQLHFSLEERVKDLEEALAHVKRLQGLFQICSYCKKLCDDQKYWHQIETYIAEHSEAEFSHVICPDCHERIVKPEIEQFKRQRETNSFGRPKKHNRK